MNVLQFLLAFSTMSLFYIGSPYKRSCLPVAVLGVHYMDTWLWLGFSDYA